MIRTFVMTLIAYVVTCLVALRFLNAVPLIKPVAKPVSSTVCVIGSCCGVICIPAEEEADFYNAYGLVTALGCCFFLISTAILMLIGE